MTNKTYEVRLSEARAVRKALVNPVKAKTVDEAVEEAVEVILAEVGKPGTNYKQVTPAERKRLKGLIEYYRKKKHPWRQCVEDNTKRFGLERAKRVCSVLKDLIYNSTKWRKGPGKANMSEDYDFSDFPEFSDDLAVMLENLPEDVIDEVVDILEDVDLKEEVTD